MKTIYSLHKPIFIVGLHRTGSTLFKNMMNLNSEVAMATDEMDFSDPWYKSFDRVAASVGDLSVAENRRMLIDIIYRGEIHGTFWKEYPGLDIPTEKIIANFDRSDHSQKSLITILLEAYREREGKKRVGVKYPVHISRLKLLYTWWPDAKVIFLIRDIRAIITSKVNDEKTRERKKQHRLLAPLIHYSALFFFLVDYVWSALVFKKYKSRYNFLKIRYEDFISKPEETVSEVCRFCEIPFEEGMLNAFGKASSITGEVKKGFDPKRISHWKTKLSTVDKWLVTGLMFPWMHTFGYGQIEQEYRNWNKSV